MKLYTFEIAPNPLRLKLYLQYKGIEIEKEEINIREMEQFTDSYKAVNPACTVPTLVLDDGSTLVDVVSIALYMETLHPEKPLFGSNAYEQASVLGWDHRIYFDGFTAIAEILRNQGEFFKDRAIPGALSIEQIPALVDRGEKRINAFFSNMDAHLQGRNYIVGDQLSFADIDAFVVVGFAGWVKKAIPAECQYMQAWYQRMKRQLGEE
ncbi:MAG: glutathione S-transferase [Oceanicoccus sp.]|jgi:glutathione S-transferase